MAEAIAKVPGISGTGALLTLADGRLTVRLTRDIWKLEPSYLELVRTIFGDREELGAIPDRGALQEVQLAIAARRDGRGVLASRARLYPDG